MAYFLGDHCLTKLKLKTIMKYKHTIRYFLERLPEPYRTLALRSTPKEIMSNHPSMGQSRGKTLWSAFTWSETPEGHTYWYKVAEDFS